MFNTNIFLIIYLSIVFLSVSGKRQTNDDDMCEIIENILCVRHVLNATTTAAKITGRLLNEIDRDIVKKYQNQNSVILNNYIQTDMDSIYPPLPSSEYHDQFFQTNNIDRVSLFFCVSMSNNFCFVLFCFLGIFGSFTCRSSSFNEFLL